MGHTRTEEVHCCQYLAPRQTHDSWHKGTTFNLEGLQTKYQFLQVP
jgi:hypothetical protein